MTPSPPTDYDDSRADTLIGLEAASPESVIISFETITPWRTIIELPSADRPLLVGSQTDLENRINTAYNLYFKPKAKQRRGIAGILAYNRRFDAHDTVGFIPTHTDYCDDALEEGSNEPVPDYQAAFDRSTARVVDRLTVRADSATERLDRLIDTIRSDLTGVECTDTRADTEYSDWLNAFNSLLDYYDSLQSPSYTIPAPFIKGCLLHSVARYPHGADKILSSAAVRLNRADNDDVSRLTTSPFAIRALLLDYAANRLDRTDNQT
jgi:hypothetical protein